MPDHLLREEPDTEHEHSHGDIDSPTRRFGPARRDEPQPPPDLWQPSAPPVPMVDVRRLTVGAASDTEELRADAVADRVVAALNGAGSRARQPGSSSADGDAVHRSAGAPNPPPASIGAGGGELSGSDSALIESRRGGGASLAGPWKERLGAAMGTDVSRVRLHTGPEARALNDRMSAVAFTSGSDIYFRDGLPDLATAPGQRLMAHELAHAVGSDGPVRRVWPWSRGGRADNSGHQSGEKSGQVAVQEEPKQGFFARTFGRLFGSGEQGAAQTVDGQGAAQAHPESIAPPGPAGPGASVAAPPPSPAAAPPQNAPAAASKPDQQNDQDAHAKAKAEADAKAKAEADAKAKAEADAKAKADAEAKAKAEAEQKAIDGRTKSFAEVSGMALGAFRGYVKSQPDWLKHSDMTNDRPALLTRILEFAGKPASGAYNYSVGDLLLVGPTPADMATALTTLTVYGAAVQNDPFPIAKADSVAKALAIGADLEKLLGAFPSWVLAAAMTDERFTQLRSHNYLDDVIAYYQGGISQPIFQAEDGADFEAYIDMRTRDNVDPRSYQSGPLSAYIRNFHRFESRLLDRLIVNLKDTSKKLPLTLVLHTTVDHNGAFHRDPEMFKVVDSPVNNTLLIEGGETLDAYTTQITPLAKKYGLHDKIDQVMFAGHGNAQNIQLAGGVVEDHEGRLTEIGEDIDVATGATTLSETEKLFDEVLANMDQLGDLQSTKQPHRRVLFNACLTNSNIVDTTLTGDDNEARRQINKWIHDNMSLATYLNDRAKSKNADVQALGANASIKQVELIDQNGGLDLATSADPKVTASKLEYVQFGTEPTGVLRAAVESYGSDASATVIAMQDRIKAHNPNSFDERIIAVEFQEFVDYKAGPERLNDLNNMSNYIEGFSHLKSPSQASPASLREALYHRFGEGIIEALLRSKIPAANAPKQRLMLRVAWLVLNKDDVARRSELMNELANNAWTAKNIIVDRHNGRYLDIEFLDYLGVLPSLFKLSGVPKRGKQLLALAGALGGSPSAACLDYLRSIRTKGDLGASSLPEVPEVPPVPAQDGPRSAIPAVPSVSGRKQVPAIAGQRPAFPAVAALPALPELPAVADAGQVAQSRPGRPGRPAAPAIPKLEPYFDASLDMDALLDGASTIEHVLSLL